MWAALEDSVVLMDTVAGVGREGGGEEGGDGSSEDNIGAHGDIIGVGIRFKL